MSGQCYLIVSRLHGLVLDVENGTVSTGTQVIPWPKNDRESQLWYDDPSTGTICSLVGNLCLDIEGFRMKFLCITLGSLVKSAIDMTITSLPALEHNFLSMSSILL